MRALHRRAKLIVFEGPDGVGKTTLSRALVVRLNNLGIPCEYLAFPGKEPETLGRLVYNLHHDPSMFGLGQISAASLQALHIAAHIDAIEQRILPSLEEGRWVVLDRFWWSTLVYGTALGVDARSLRAMIQLERLHWKGVKPAVLLLVNSKVACCSPLSETHDKVLNGYKALVERKRAGFTVRTIQNDSSIQDTLNKVLFALEHLIPQTGKALKGVTQQAPVRQLDLPPPGGSRLSTLSKLSPARPTIVYDTYWRFAAERQEVFFRKLEGSQPPWTNDPILTRYKFTNPYRASDRVSQYLIRHVIYEGDPSPEEVFFRTILFKVFNKIETWGLLKATLGHISYADFSFERYDEVLTEAMLSGQRIYSAAYIMPSGRSAFGHPKKHRNHLRLIERMMADEVALRLVDARGMAGVFDILRSYPTIGDFLGYQFATDINYSELTNFSEMEFVMPGPGALDGIHKCFSHLGGLNESDIIRLVADRQEQEFKRLGLRFRSLWGRRLQFIDCQNLFCEVGKYARIKHPEIKGVGNRIRIKQTYRPSKKAIAYWYPPKWGINDLILQAERE